MLQPACIGGVDHRLASLSTGKQKDCHCLCIQGAASQIHPHCTHMQEVPWLVTGTGVKDQL